MEDSKMEAQAPIIFGQDLISTHGILNYIIKPDNFCAVTPPAQAPEEFIDNDEHCVLPFSAALLDAASPPDLTTTSARQAQSMAAIGEHPYDYNSEEHIHKKKSINYEPMKAKLIKPFSGVPPRRINREKQLFLKK